MRAGAADPFGERSPAPYRTRLDVLGAAFTVESSTAAALKLAVDAFGGLPRHRLHDATRRFRLRLVTTEHRSAWPRSAEPPRPTLSAGNGLLCATVDSGNFAVIDVSQARALVCMSPAMLRRPYHARYELIELAMVTLASRAQSLVPLHAACVGARGSGILLMGPSGAGKSTLALHALAAGMQLLSEDSAFVAADTMLVTGAPNYLHVTPSALAFLDEDPLLAHIRRSPMIRRRSGTAKHELDLRTVQGRLAAAPLRAAAIVFLSRRKAGRAPLLERLDRNTLVPRLRREQPYAAAGPEWRAFERRVVTVPSYELRRAEHPNVAIRELRDVLRRSTRRPP
jgi:hypothetical protein